MEMNYRVIIPDSSIDRVNNLPEELLTGSLECNLESRTLLLDKDNLNLEPYVKELPKLIR
jgi:hypothetical protein